MILLLKQLLFRGMWIIPEGELWETPRDALKVETRCPDGDSGICAYYVFTLKPLPDGLIRTIKRLLKLAHYNVEDEEQILSVANALITVYNSTCRELVTPAKLVYEMAKKAGFEIETREVEYDHGTQKTYYYIKGVGTVIRLRRMSTWCQIAHKRIKRSLVERWIL